MSASSSEAEILACAEALRQARIDVKAIGPVKDRLADVNAAYAVQDAITKRDLADGRRIVGRKIGLTSRAVQTQLGVSEPDYGVLVADMNRDPGEPIPVTSLIAPKIEAEIAFVMGRDLDLEVPALHEVIRAVDFALPALEIVDSRIADWKISIIDTIADNASSGLFVLGGTPRRLSGEDLAMAGMVLEANGDPVSFGAGAACLGHPLNALRWLARRLTELGQPLRAGDVVLSGALGPMVPVRAGQTYEARINGVGSVRASFGQGEGQ